jgi:aubergine-like protein
MRLNILKNTGMYEYHVDFEPPIEARRLKRQVLKRSDVHIGSVINFDGAKLYLPIRLAEKVLIY